MRRARHRAFIVALLLGVGACPGASTAGARVAPAAAPSRPGPRERAPSGPPLVGNRSAGTSEQAEGEGPGLPQDEIDPLVRNGLASPLCRGSVGGAQLAAAGRSNCNTSGFLAAPAPTGNYGLDVHIDTGPFGLSSGALLSVVQDLVVSPLWMSIVWAVHAVVVMLEWAFTVDVLDSAMGGGLGAGLRQMQTAITVPWLAAVLAVAATFAAYDGIVRRRVSDTFGHLLAMGTMMAAALWVVADPVGTVGALGAWSDQASVGALAAVVDGSPVRAGRALGEGLSTTFTVAVEGPWCYLEFGDVGWCHEPSRLDPRLRAAALRIADRELAAARCKSALGASAPCPSVGESEARALEHGAQLLRQARSNGAVFLALPPNGAARNSINAEGSLLRAICRSAQATQCRGPAAAEAEFRTNSGTWPRVGGLLLIAGGVLGMICLIGFIGVRLLTAAVFSLLFLLLSPVMALSPALGDTGRGVFRKWAGQLLSAVLSKILFAFLLGAVLDVTGVLSRLSALGWWTQWLLMSAFWWAAFARRHKMLAIAPAPFAPRHLQRAGGRRLADAIVAPRSAVAQARVAHLRRRERALVLSDSGQRALTPRYRALLHSRPPVTAAHLQASEGPDLQARQLLVAARGEAADRRGLARTIEGELANRRAQLQRVRAGQARAGRSGDRRGELRLSHRAGRVDEEIARLQALSRARDLAAPAHPLHGARALAGFRRFLDDQTAMAPARAAAARSAPRRDYGALAALAGITRAEYERLSPGPRRAARLAIDRELAQRARLRGITPSSAAQERLSSPYAIAYPGRVGEYQPQASGVSSGRREPPHAREGAIRPSCAMRSRSTRGGNASSESAAIDRRLDRHRARPQRRR